MPGSRSPSYMKTDHMAPFYDLLSQSTTFEWNEDLNTAFKRSWEKIVELIEVVWQPWT